MSHLPGGLFHGSGEDATGGRGRFLARLLPPAFLRYTPTPTPTACVGLNRGATRPGRCIVTHLQKRRECPLCRQPIRVCMDPTPANRPTTEQTTNHTPTRPSRPVAWRNGSLLPHHCQWREVVGEEPRRAPWTR